MEIMCFRLSQAPLCSIYFKYLQSIFHGSTYSGNMNTEKLLLCFYGVSSTNQ
jgi:hypothetical protein